MRKNKFIAMFLICLTLVINMFGKVSIQASAEEKNFKGTRLVEYSVDKSDIDNFIDGGKPAFDLILRANAPDWLNYQMLSEGRDFLLRAQFEFDSYEDYFKKLSELLTYSPAVVYSTDNGLMLLESHSAIELLNFLQAVLFSRGCIDEKRLDDIFAIEANEISINSTNYQSGERISIHPEDNSLIKFDSLDIDTKSNEDGSFVREISVNMSSSDDDKTDMLLSRFEQVGETEADEIGEDNMQICVEFNANNQSELIEKTMVCLGTATSILEKQKYLDENTVSVERCEFFDLENLINEEGTFNYTHNYPTFVSNITADDDSVHVSDSMVSAENISEIVCQYERGIKFSTIEVYTDLSDFFGKLKRTITFTVSTDIAPDYHKKIKKEFQKRLVRGTTFNIYDEGGKRHYEVSFSTFLVDELSEFNKAILNTDYNIEYSNSWIPFGNSDIYERIEFDNVLEGTIPSDELVVSYKLPKITLVSSDEIEEKGAVVYSVKSTDRINLEFRSLNVLKLLIELFPIIVIVIVVLILLHKKKKKSKQKVSI